MTRLSPHEKPSDDTVFFDIAVEASKGEEAIAYRRRT
jgi:hypothetical protein